MLGLLCRLQSTKHIIPPHPLRYNFIQDLIDTCEEFRNINMAQQQLCLFNSFTGLFCLLLQNEVPTSHRMPVEG